LHTSHSTPSETRSERWQSHQSTSRQMRSIRGPTVWHLLQVVRHLRFSCRLGSKKRADKNGICCGGGLCFSDNCVKKPDSDVNSIRTLAVIVRFNASLECGDAHDHQPAKRKAAMRPVMLRLAESRGCASWQVHDTAASASSAIAFRVSARIPSLQSASAVYGWAESRIVAMM
jgi:hypothetical protein